MEPTNHSFRKEHDPPNLQGIVFHANLQGCNFTVRHVNARDATSCGLTIFAAVLLALSSLAASRLRAAALRETRHIKESQLSKLNIPLRNR